MLLQIARPRGVALRLPLLVFAWLAIPGEAPAQTDPSLWAARPPTGEHGEAAAATRVTEDTRRPSATADAGTALEPELVIAPIPIINPTLDNGVALAVGMLYPIGHVGPLTRPSATLVTGLVTSNDSWAVGGVQTLHLRDERYRAAVAGGYADVNVPFYGIGTSAGAEGRSILLNQAGAALVTQLLVRAGGQWYVGGKYRLMRMRVAADLGDVQVPVPADDRELRTGLLGPHVERDTRDDSFYPRSGTLFDITALFAGSKVGGQRTYQSFQTSLSSYIGVGSRQVIASRLTGCVVSGEAPFYDMCMIGQYQDLRGYPAGQYRDQLLFSGQAEYRLELWWRFGIAAFGGLGEVASSANALTADALLPSGGAGLRFRVTSRNHLNLRADYAWGKQSSAIYVSIGEAF